MSVQCPTFLCSCGLVHHEGPELSSFTALEGRFGWCGLYACSSGMCLRWELYEMQDCNVDIEPYCLKVLCSS